MSYIGRTPTNAALTASDLADGIVSTAKIAADAVTDAKIADDVVGTEHLTANEVDTTALGADAVTGAQLADDAVNSEHYTDGSIDTAHLADGQVTTAKLATAVFTGATDIGADIADADLFLLDDGAGGTIRKTAASRIKTYVGGGLAVADQWRLNSTYTVTNSSAALTNLEQVDTDGFGGIGTAMSVSSGIFTFPSTGIYLITGTAYLYRENSGAPNVSLQLQTTTDNSSYNGAAISAATVENVSSYEANINLSFMFDVTNTTTHKCKFMANSSDNNIATMYAETAQNTTYFTFLKLGDT
jgi:hypothetical protein